MGTRGTVHIIHEGKPLASVYRQMDSYPEGLGAEIKTVLKNGESVIVNGYNMKQNSPEYFNGMMCLGAYLIGELKINPYQGDRKEVIGNVYLTTADDRQEYNYFLSQIGDKIHLKLTDSSDETIYEGLLSKFNPGNIKE